MIKEININNKWINFDDSLLEIKTSGTRNYFYYDKIKIKARCEIKFICNKCKSISHFANFNLKDKNSWNYICGGCARSDFYQKNYGVENVSQLKKIKEKKKQTMIKNYGTNSVASLPQTKITLKEKYGVENISQSKETKKKKIKNSLNKYGVEYSWQREDVKVKTKKTNLEKYGKMFFPQTDECKEKIKLTNLDRYGVENISQSKEIKNKIKQTNLKKYGKEFFSQTNEYKNRVKKTNLEKYGVEYGLQSEKIKNKIKQTNLEKYGVENPSISLDIKEKIKKSNLKKYGKEFFSQTNEYKNRVKQTNLEKYGVENVSQLSEVKNKVKKQSIKNGHNKMKLTKVIPLFTLEDYLLKENKYDKFMWKCITCHKEFQGYYANGKEPRCPICFPYYKSMGEQEIVTYIKSLNINIIENSKSIITPLELDIYIPDKKIAIEYNGLYWHSEEQGKDKKYHLNKTIECEKQGIRLLHIFEDEWLNKQEIIKNIINISLGFVSNKIGARKCIIKELESKNTRNFLDDNHIQGYIPAKVNLGLYYQDELISLLTFSKSRFNKKYEWEILRFVNKQGYSIIGGFSKMLKYFRENYSGDIITYSDRRLFSGGVYSKNLTKLKPSSPAYFYVKNGQRYNRQKFMKHKLKDKLEVFNSELTEGENMKINGYLRIYDCGNNTFELRNNNGIY